jgi:Ca2+/H+ antiporter, TMEM165/GDT1 family
MDPFTLSVAAMPAFVASVVEFVEAFTIVLAVGNTRGWRAPLWGTAAALVTLAVVVALFGGPVLIYEDQISQYFHLVVGTLLLLFGMRWLRKAILRFAGVIALHDEEMIYQREVTELRARGISPSRWDNLGFWISYKAVLLEGTEVAFIVIALGLQGPESLRAAITGASMAFLVTAMLSAVLHRPLSFVPENWMKFLVGTMLVTFGVYWGAEGFHGRWIWGSSSLLVVFALISVISWICVRMFSVLPPNRAQVARRSV